MSKTWCPLPWISQAVRNNGDIRVCCHASPSKSKGLLKKEDGTTYNAVSDDLEEARNSSTIKKIRLDMLEGKHPSACIRCETEEKSNILSRRQYETKNWQNFYSAEKAKTDTAKDGAVNPSKAPLVYYDLRFGNRCNLKCRMCGPTDSDLWYSDHVKVWNTNSFQDSHGPVKLTKQKNGLYKTENHDYDWVDSPSFWKQMKKKAADIRHLYTVGGEPLLIDKHYELLEAIIKYGDPRQVTIEYNTNLTLLPEKALKLWKLFKQIRVGISIDSCGAVNDYIRYPSRFKKIEKNMDIIDKSFNNMLSWIATTVSAYNIFHLPDLIQWKIQKKFIKINHITSHVPILTTHPLHTPHYLNVKMLPKDYKDQVTKKFNQFTHSFPSWLKTQEVSKKDSLRLIPAAKKMLKGYADYMNSENWSHLTPQFWKYTCSLDKIRKEKLKDMIPELYQSLYKNIREAETC